MREICFVDPACLFCQSWLGVRHALVHPGIIPAVSAWYVCQIEIGNRANRGNGPSFLQPFVDFGMAIHEGKIPPAAMLAGWQVAPFRREWRAGRREHK